MRGRSLCLAGLGVGLFAAGAALVPPVASAAPIELVEQREQFLLMRDFEGGLATANWFARDPFLEAFGEVEGGLLAVHPDDSQFIVMFTTFKLPAGIGALYQSVANDVEGIGYEHIAELDAVIPQAIFDDTPDSQVIGFLHMNEWTQYLGEDPGGVNDRLISLIFGQELGHAWLAFPHYLDAEGTDRSDILGRADAHWSFYLNSGGSPVEGHAWTDNRDGTFTAVKQDFYTFSDLDLYLMGLLPPQDVAPFFIIDDPHDCIDAASEDGSCAPPEAFRFQADQYRVSGTRRDLTVDDVIAAQGARLPAFPDAPTEYDVSFILVLGPGDVLDEGELALVDAIVERSIEVFNEQTRGLASVVNRTAAPDTDDDDDDGTDTDTGVDPDAGGIETDDAAADDGDTDGPGADDDDDDGCSCRVPTRNDAPRWSGLLVLAGVAALRRRRR